ncbi:pentapeptide repeat-containing protein [Silvibacterium bohemicum]|uniref:pentapeptide repeat-containing protein n=1 Tax=Silvibacterium bohemicum TaxID=1577686 RepID=UPI0035D467A7
MTGDVRGDRLRRREKPARDSAGTDISGSDMPGADMSGSNLSKANPSGPDICGASLREQLDDASCVSEIYHISCRGPVCVVDSLLKFVRSCDSSAIVCERLQQQLTRICAARSISNFYRASTRAERGDIFRCIFASPPVINSRKGSSRYLYSHERFVRQA